MSALEAAVGGLAESAAVDKEDNVVVSAGTAAHGRDGKARQAVAVAATGAAADTAASARDDASVSARDCSVWMCCGDGPDADLTNAWIVAISAA